MGGDGITSADLLEHRASGSKPMQEPLATKKEQRTNKVKRSKASWVLISLTSNQWTYAKEEHDTGESNFHIKSRVDSKELGRIKQQERRRFQGIRWGQTTRRK